MNKTKIGTLKEVKDREGRVGLTPAGVKALTDKGHVVVVERRAGVASGFVDHDYMKAGAIVVDTPEEVVENVDILVKVKEPVESEYDWLPLLKNKTLFTFLHLADNPRLAELLLENEITGVSYDTIEDENGRLPLLKPMSEIAGRYAIKIWGSNLNPCNNLIRNVVVVGGGVAGEAAVKEALNNDEICDISVLEKNLARAKQLEELFYDDPVDVYSCSKHLPKLLKKADLLVGAVLVKGAKAPKVVTKEHLALMKNGGRVVDIAIDQGGCVYGSKPTTHTEPFFEQDNLVYCCVPNMPGMYPREATEALTKETLPHLLKMAEIGAFDYFASKSHLLPGLNTHGVYLLNETVAKELGMEDKFKRVLKFDISLAQAREALTHLGTGEI